MLDIVRNLVSSIFGKILLGIMVLSFALWGVGDILTSGNSQLAAKIGKEKITLEEFYNEFQKTVNEYNQLTQSNISLKEAMVYDHSSVWRPLSVFGDIKTVPVASGAELMAYTNFDGDNNIEHGNYLMQEYVDNAYMDFTGDFNISFWFDGNLGGTGTALEIKWVNDDGDNGWMIHINTQTSYFLDGDWDTYSAYKQIDHLFEKGFKSLRILLCKLLFDVAKILPPVSAA